MTSNAKGLFQSRHLLSISRSTVCVRASVISVSMVNPAVSAYFRTGIKEVTLGRTERGHFVTLVKIILPLTACISGHREAMLKRRTKTVACTLVANYIN